LTETPPEEHYAYVRAQGVREKARQILNFCSKTTLKNNINLYGRPATALQYSTWTAVEFWDTDFVNFCFVLFYITFQFCV